MAVTMGQFPHKWRRLTDRCGSTDNTIDGACEHQGSFKENRNKETYIDIQEENVKLFRIHNEERNLEKALWKEVRQRVTYLISLCQWMAEERQRMMVIGKDLFDQQRTGSHDSLCPEITWHIKEKKGPQLCN